MSARAAGLLLGFTADRLWGDPQRFHPVAGFGRVAGALEKRWYRDSRAAGIGYAATLVIGSAAAAALLARISRSPAGTVLTTAAGTWAVLGGRSLEREAVAVADFLVAGDLPGARTQVARLVGRNTAELTGNGVARAAVESVAENTSDAVVAPLVWGAVAGLPGLLGYRAANTLDAMVGHHSPRYENFGWAAARFDDLVNLVPARLSGLLTCLTASPGTRRDAWRIARRDGKHHPSPNGGQVEAAFAGALGIRLGGTNDYAGRQERRPTLGDGRPATGPDIVAAARLARRVDVAAVLVSAAAAALIGRVRRSRSNRARSA